MVDQIQDLDSLKKEIAPDKVIEAINILFLDISSACTGYSIANVNFTGKQVKFTKSGAIWLNPNWSHQEKYSYMFGVICNYFWVGEAIDYIVVEQYSVNPKKMMGINVVSEMQGAIKAAAWENGVKVTSVLPQTWRKHLQIKRNSEGDFKQPTKDKVLTYVKVPEESISNITGSSRTTPTDLYDALAIGIAWLIKLGFDDTKMKFDDMKFNDHIGRQLGRD
jgi:Holliday junction resolvasome RuvABC endonuclease subunit